MRGLALALTLLLPLPLCAEPEDSADVEARLRARAQAYWKLKVALDPKLLDFYVPLAKGGPAPESISEFGSVQYRSAELLRVKVDGERGLVETRNDVYFTGNIRQPSERHRYVELSQLWTRVDGQWYRVPPDPDDDVFVRFGKKRDAHRAKQKESGGDTPREAGPPPPEEGAK